MRMSRFFPGTLRQAPAEAETASHQLLLRAGLVRALGPGVHAYLPLGVRVRRRIQELATQAMVAWGGEEAALPPVAPVEPWIEAHPRRWRSHGASLRDRSDRAYLLSERIEPLATAWVRPDLTSHRLLPLLLYGYRSRFAAEMPPRPSPLSPRQSLLLEALAFQPDQQAGTAAAADLHAALVDIFHRCGLEVQAAEAAVGREGFPAHVFVDPRVPGQTGFAHCPECGYAAHLEVARRAKPAPPAEEPLPVEDVHTPDCHTIAELAAFLGVPRSRTAKAVFFVVEDRFLFLIVRGDMDVNEAKVARLFDVDVEELRPAQEHEIEALGASPGYASPMGIGRSAPDVGLREVLIVVDELIPHCPNLVTGANAEDMHRRNVNYGRDYVADHVADLVAVEAGDPCPHCQSPLDLFHSTVLGRVWSTRDHYGEVLEATYLDAEGERRPLFLACGEVDLDRVLAAVVEAHHDENGLLWPTALAPYAIYLLTIGGAPEVEEAALALYEELTAAGLAVILDDRSESAGVKFTDADLLGIPLRVAVSKRTVRQESAEVKRRDQPRDAAEMIALQDVVAWVRAGLEHLQAEEKRGGDDA